MRKYGLRSAVMTILDFRLIKLITREEAKNDDLDPPRTFLSRQQLLSEDLELFYTCRQNSESEPEAGANFFLSQQLAEEEFTLLENRNNDYLNTFNLYYPLGGSSGIFDRDMQIIGKSSDPESIFSRGDGFRWTIVLNITLLEKMRKRASNEDLSDTESKKHRVQSENGAEIAI